MTDDNLEERRHRVLTDDDVNAIASALEGKIVNRFYRRFGEGVFALVWRGIIAIALFVAAFGAGKHWGGQ
jgi:hypothetical protein